MNDEVLFDVFISYNSEDRDAATALAELLKTAGLRVWFDQWCSRPGMAWQDELKGNLSKCRAIAVLIGPSGMGRWQTPEVRTALNGFEARGHPIIPVILPGVRTLDLPTFLDQHTLVDWRPQQTIRESVERLIWGITGRRLITSVSQMGDEFFLEIPRQSVPPKTIRLRTLPNPSRHRLLDLTWETFGCGIEILAEQIRSPGSRIGIDACFGVNDAGLVMATFIGAAVLGRPSLGYIKCGKAGERPNILDDSVFPSTRVDPCIMLFDFEVKHSNVVQMITEELRRRYGNPTFFFAVYGAMTESADLRLHSFDELVSATNLKAIGLSDIFIACTMHSPGIEPPMGLA